MNVLCRNRKERLFNNCLQMEIWMTLMSAGCKESWVRNLQDSQENPLGV